MKQPRIAIIDDQLLFRKGLIAILQEQYKMEVAIESEGGQDFIDKLANDTKPPQIVLLDLEMPVMNGKEVAEYLKKNHSKIKIIILSVHYNSDLIAHFIEMGAVCYLPKNIEPEVLKTAILEVFKNDFYFTDDIILALRRLITNKGKNKNTILVGNHLLTTREKEILELICQQYNTTEIAEKLFISPRTVEGHRNSLLAKTGARNTAGLVLFAVTNNIISPYSSPL